MSQLKSVAVVLGLALGTLVLATGEAQAAKNKYSMVAFKNNQDFTINYRFRWGKDAEWKEYSLKPGESRWHSWKFEYVNENSAPKPQIKFDQDLSDDTDWIIYDLTGYNSPDQDIDNAKLYKFTVRLKGKVLGLVSAD